jgi:hypothetical protein
MSPEFPFLPEILELMRPKICKDFRFHLKDIRYFLHLGLVSDRVSYHASNYTRIFGDANTFSPHPAEDFDPKIHKLKPPTILDKILTSPDLYFGFQIPTDLRIPEVELKPFPVTSNFPKPYSFPLFSQVCDMLKTCITKIKMCELIEILQELLIFGANVDLTFSISVHVLMMEKLFTVLPLSKELLLFVRDMLLAGWWEGHISSLYGFLAWEARNVPPTLLPLLSDLVLLTVILSLPTDFSHLLIHEFLLIDRYFGCTLYP